jgi:diacylglycerol kinase (ATP)
MTNNKIIVNPISGRGNGEKMFPWVDKHLRELGIDFEICRTESPGHAIDLAAQACADSFDNVVAVGGDGTANEVLNGLMKAVEQGIKPSALGFISVGQGNDFAFGVGIPTDLKAACQTLAQGCRKWIDVGFVQGGDYPKGRYFGNGIGIGFDAMVGFEALKIRHLHGFLSYMVAALKTISLYFNAPLLKIEFDGTILTQPSLMVSVMNGRRMGGGFMMAPDGLPDDGVFDLCIAGQVSRAVILSLIPRFMRGTQSGHPAIRTARAAQVSITAVQGSLPAHADGETLCHAGERLEARILPKALQVVVPGDSQIP